MTQPREGRQIWRAWRVGESESPAPAGAPDRNRKGNSFPRLAPWAKFSRPIRGLAVALVERMQELNKQKHDVGAGLRPALTTPPGGFVGAGFKPAPTTDLEREIAATDAEIDKLVYELYGITDEDRKIIEGG